MLNIVASTNHKHNCVSKRRFRPRHLVAKIKNTASLVCCGYLAGFLASKDLGIEIPELLIHLSLLLLHDLVHNLRQRQVVLLHHQILNTSHDKVATLADEVAEHGDRLGGSLTTGSCCFNHLAALSCSTLPQLHE